MASSLDRIVALTTVKAHVSHSKAGKLEFIREHQDSRSAVERLPEPTTAGHVPATPEDRKRLAVPPAWSGVTVATDPEATLLARGRDAKGRQKSIYSVAYHRQQAARKFARVKVLHGKIKGLDDALGKDSVQDDTAGAVLLSRRMGLRPGSTKDTKADKQAYGSSTLLAKHASVTDDGKTHLDFVGKGGKNLRFTTSDPHVHAAVKARLDKSPDPESRLFDTTPEKMGHYVRTRTGGKFLVKDLRTYHANALALQHVHSQPLPQTKREFQAARKATGVHVSSHLGNTPAMALSAYINPTVFDHWVKDESWLA